MHGRVIFQLTSHIIRFYGLDIWNLVQQEADLSSKLYSASQIYPDEEFMTLIVSLSKLTGTDKSEILERFGDDMITGMFKLYGIHFNSAWTTFDFLENLDMTISNAFPSSSGIVHPKLSIIHNIPDAMTLTYCSPRHLCEMVRGIIRGLARHYDENITVAESQYMQNGDPICEISLILANQQNIDEKSTEIIDVSVGGIESCWEFLNCPQVKRDMCPAYPNTGNACWLVASTLCINEKEPQGSFTEKFKDCANCTWYQQQIKSRYDNSAEAKPEKMPHS